jgi:hypothetical protein
MPGCGCGSEDYTSTQQGERGSRPPRGSRTTRALLTRPTTDLPEGGSGGALSKVASIPRRSGDRATTEVYARERKVTSQRGCEGTIPRGSKVFLAC